MLPMLPMLQLRRRPPDRPGALPTTPSGGTQMLPHRSQSMAWTRSSFASLSDFSLPLAPAWAQELRSAIAKLGGRIQRLETLRLEDYALSGPFSAWLRAA